MRGPLLLIIIQPLRSRHSRPPRTRREINPQRPPGDNFARQFSHCSFRTWYVHKIRMREASRLARPPINRYPHINHVLDLPK